MGNVRWDAAIWSVAIGADVGAYVLAVVETRVPSGRRKKAVSAA